MQFLTFILLQLEEACRYLLDGRIAQLRLALLLLDNAAEIQMDRSITSQLNYEATREQIRQRVLELPIDSLTRSLQELAEWQPLTADEKYSVSRYFDEKLKFLTTRTKTLDLRLANVLSYLHKYRNEAYHYAKVRKSTIETAAKLLLDINCEILLSVPQGGGWYASNEDYSWLEKQYNKSALTIFHDRDFPATAVSEFRKRVNIGDRAVGSLLSKHLCDRIAETFDALDFVVENTRCPDRQTCINDSYDFGVSHYKKRGERSPIPKASKPNHTVEFLESLNARSEGIAGENHRFEAFRKFSELEKQFEPVEQSVQILWSAVDEMIQLEIDISLGK